MSDVYYNEIDATNCLWLERLMQQGTIPEGHIDGRDIRLVRPEDVAGYRQCHFFAGIGGWAEALRLANWPADRRIWSGSCPCQPWSVAGKGAGADDPRHLWPAWERLILQCRPPTVVGEQTAGADGLYWIDLVYAGLEGADYALWTSDLPACSVGTFHRRQRLWFVADTDTPGCGVVSARRLHEGGPSGDDVAGRGALGDSNGARRKGDGLSTLRRVWHRRGPHAGAPRSGAVDGVDDTERERLQGLRGDEHDGDESGRVGAGAVGSVAAAGASDVAVANAHKRRRRVHGRAAGDSGAQESKSHAEQRGGDSAVADSERDGGRPDVAERGPQGRTINGRTRAGFWDNAEWIPCRDGKARPIESGTSALVNGVSGRVVVRVPLENGETLDHWYSRTVALKGYGNAIVPELTAEILTAYLECDR